MIHRFVDIIESAAIVYMLGEENSDLGDPFTISLWAVSPDGGTPYPIPSSTITIGSGDLLGDPMTSPDGTEIAWTRITTSGADSLYVTPSDGTGLTPTLLVADTSAPDVSMQGSWHPDSSKLVFRDLDSGGSADHRIRTVNRDGSGVTTLYTRANTNGNLSFPRYNHDGTLIAFVENSAELWVMNADGSGATQIKTGTFVEGAEPSWANTQDKLAYWTTGGQWRTINADGTGDTLLATDPNPFWGLNRYAWTLDDSALLAFYRDPGASPPRGKLTSIDTSGGGATTLSPDRFSYVSSEKHLASVFPNGRVYWALWDITDSVPEEVVSCLPDGSDYRVEHDLGSPTAPYDALQWRGLHNRST